MVWPAFSKVSVRQGGEGVVDVQFLAAGIYGGGHSRHSSGKERQKSLKGTVP